MLRRPLTPLEIVSLVIEVFRIILRWWMILR